MMEYNWKIRRQLEASFDILVCEWCVLCFSSPKAETERNAGTLEPAVEFS